jgi:dolichol kinase
MTNIFIALAPVGSVLFMSELLWRLKKLKGERARKFIHILAGVWIAFWPFYLPFDGIFILGCVALVFLLYSRHAKVFKAIYAVKRRTYGEIFYAVAIILCASFGQQPWIFTVSILLLALADGGAAVVGRFWGYNNQYRIFGSRNLVKSIAGTTAFVVLTYVSLCIGWFVGGNTVLGENIIVAFFLLPFTLTMLENMSPYGLDNLITPIFTTVLLNSLL